MKWHRTALVGVAALTLGTSIPIIPTNDSLRVSYQTTCFDAMNPPPILPGKEAFYYPNHVPDACTNGQLGPQDNVFYSIFKTQDGSYVFLDIPMAQYQAMGKIGGIKDNPSHQTNVSILGMTTHKAKAAVGFDNSTLQAFSGGTVASQTFSHTVTTATNDVVLGGSFQDQAAQSDNSTTATYNSVSMTKLTGQSGSGAGFTGGMAVFWVTGTASGANNMVINYSPNTRVGAIAGSYTGVNQSNPVDNSTSGAPTTVNLTASVTVNTANSWAVLFAIDDTGALASAGSGTTLRQAGGSGNNLADSNTALSTGSQSLIINDAATHWTYIILSIKVPGIRFVPAFDF